MELISMTDFVLNKQGEILNSELGTISCKYANFLKQPLTLGMFVPCGEAGNVLQEPDASKFTMDNVNSFDIFRELTAYYRAAKERVLFEGFYVSFNMVVSEYITISHGNGFGLDYNKFYSYFDDYNTIEDLTSYGLTLTQTAIKQINE